MGMPIDKNGVAIPALSLKSTGGAHVLDAVSTGPVRNAVPFSANTQVVSILALVPVFIAMGDANVDAVVDGHYYPANLYYDFSIGNFKNHGSDGSFFPQKTHISVRAVSQAGKVYLSEKE